MIYSDTSPGLGASKSLLYNLDFLQHVARQWLAAKRAQEWKKGKMSKQKEAERDGDGIPAAEAEDVKSVCLAQVSLW